MKKIFLIILGLFLCGVIVVPRFYHLGTEPLGLHIDEVSFAADAKAIAETGRDTWGVRYPMVFKAFGEWKAPGLVYSMTFWYKVLGVMNNTVTRLPSAISGLVILLVLGLTLRELKPKMSLGVIAFAIGALAFSPWHFDMSRIFYEAFSALAFIAMSIWFITKATLSDSKKLSPWWILAAVMAGIAGYYYASIRYVVIITLLVAVVVQSWSLKDKLKSGAILLLVLFSIGLGWTSELLSEKGLNRLHYYQAKSAQGSTLEIDEKRQYCYLSLNKDVGKSKFCYLIWNKPVYKVINAAKMYYTYLGSDFMFLRAESEFGFDSEYGAYLLPLLPIYLIGLYELLHGTFLYLSSVLLKKSKSTSQDRLYAIYVAISLISLIPAAIANNVNMRMGLIPLYIAAIAIGIGTKIATDWVRAHLGKLSVLVYLAYVLVLLFFITQSMLHYFLVFIHSNDLMWTSDARSVFGYVTSVSKDYDHIVDSDLHGPLAPYFYGDITTSEVQGGSHSAPDDFGFTYLTSAGKYELRHVNIRDLACEKLRSGDKRRTLVITSPVPELSSISKFSGRSWSGALLLREVYDVDDIIAREVKLNASFNQNCQSKTK
jgi:hypothetical protein